MRKNLIKLVVVLLSCAPTGRAVEAVEESAAELQARKSVYRIRPSVDGPLLGAAALGASVPLLFEKQMVKEECPCDPDDVNSFDRPVIGNDSDLAGTISHLTVGVAIGAPLIFDAVDVGWNKTLVEDTVVFLEALSIQSSLAHIGRYGVQRPRPDVYGKTPEETVPSDFLSFYSGHVGTVFAGMSAASMTYGYRYGHTWWPWALTAVLGVSDAAERVMAGSHFYSDVIVGAVAGTLVGTLVPMMHHRKGNSNWSVLPQVGPKEAQLVWRQKF